MNIVMLAAHACIRVSKEALPLIENGHKVHIICFKLPSFADNFTSVVRCFDVGQMREAVKIYADKADVFHVHNEPSWFVTLVKEITDKPVILDVHDSFLTRLTPEEEDQRSEKGERRIRIQTDERNNLQMADALIFPGKRFRDQVTSEFSLTQPNIVLPSYLPESLYCYDTKEWLGGLVYEGRVDLQKEVDSDPKSYGFRYCVYEEMARKCKELGIDFHLQVVRKDSAFMEAYKETAFVHVPAAWDRLLREISQHDWGLVGNIFPTHQWDAALPNKLFEYMAAGVPIVAINARESADFVEEHGLGIEVGSVEELAERWSEHTKCRKTLIRNRTGLSMNSHIHELENLYKGFSA